MTMETIVGSFESQQNILAFPAGSLKLPVQTEKYVKPDQTRSPESVRIYAPL